MKMYNKLLKNNKIILLISKFRVVSVLLIVGILLTTNSGIVRALDSTPPVTTASLNGTLGSNSWYVTTVDLSLTAADPESGVASTEYWVDSNAHNIVTYLPGAPTEVSFNVSSQGSHVVHYFSTNKDGVAETEKVTSSFKIDTVAPMNWRDFTATQSGNDHTYILSFTVDDATSGLDPSSAYYNYSLNGTSFGYYSTTTSCNSTWIPQDPAKNPPDLGSGWKAIASVTPGTPGSQTVEVRTHAIDFCDSNFNLNEKIRFYIKDMAGNVSIKTQLLFGSWLLLEGGNFHSQGLVDFGAQSTADYLVSANISPITNMVSDKSWYLAPYNLSTINTNYNTLYAKLGSPRTSLPSGKLPKVKGVYYVNDDFTIDNQTIPSGLSSVQNFGAVIFVKGKLTINRDYTLHPTSNLVFVVDDGFYIENHVSSVSGYFIVDGNVDISYNGEGDDQFTLEGGILGNGRWHFGHDLGDRNFHDDHDDDDDDEDRRDHHHPGAPSEIFVFKPSIYVNNDILSFLAASSTYNWSEVAP